MKNSVLGVQGRRSYRDFLERVVVLLWLYCAQGCAINCDPYCVAITCAHSHCSRFHVPIRIVCDYMCLFALHGDSRSVDLHRSRLHVTISIARMPMLTGAYCPWLADFDEHDCNCSGVLEFWILIFLRKGEIRNLECLVAMHARDILELRKGNLQKLINLAGGLLHSTIPRLAKFQSPISRRQALLLQYQPQNVSPDINRWPHLWT